LRATDPHATFSLPRNASPSAPRPRNLKPLARPATPSRTCESLPDQGYDIGTCYYGTRALHLWAPLHSKWPQKSSEDGTVRYCETIFVGEAWLKHHNTTGHNGEKVSTWTKRPARYREKVECELGCGLALQRDRMKRHHKSEHRVQIEYSSPPARKSTSTALSMFPTCWLKICFENAGTRRILSPAIHDSLALLSRTPSPTKEVTQRAGSAAQRQSIELVTMAASCCFLFLPNIILLRISRVKK